MELRPDGPRSRSHEAGSRSGQISESNTAALAIRVWLEVWTHASSPLVPGPKRSNRRFDERVFPLADLDPAVIVRQLQPRASEAESGRRRHSELHNELQHKD